MRFSRSFWRRGILFLTLTTTSYATLHAQQIRQVQPSQQLQRVSPAIKKRATDLLQKNLRMTGLNQVSLSSYVVTDAYPDVKSGHFLVYLQQTYLGYPVHNKIGVYAFRNDSLVATQPNYISRIQSKAPAKAAFSVPSDQAVRNAAANVSMTMPQPTVKESDDVLRRYVYDPGTEQLNDIRSELVWVAVNNEREYKLAWNVLLMSADGSQAWYVRVDAGSGEIIDKSNLVVSEQFNCASMEVPVQAPARNVASTLLLPVLAPPPPPPTATSVSYNVYPFPLESPNFGSRSVEVNPWSKAGSGNNATTLGWQFDNANNYVYTRGNNVWALEDLSGTQDYYNPLTGISDTSTTATPTLTFDRNLTPANNPSSFSNMRAGMDNLFYWNNIMHDISYQYGFDEAAGNFQTSNLGRGGVEGDPVRAFAQDGTGINNANFLTPPDGYSGAMRMYQWNTAISSSLQVNAPSAIINTYSVAEGSNSFKNRLSYTGPITADIVKAIDASTGTTSNGCGTFSNAAALAGKIALIDRGGCNFAPKIKNVQNAGAIAVIVVNNASNPVLSTMTGTDTTITIPAVMISQADGNTLKSNLTGLNGTLSATGSYIDGALDGGVMSHEYTHGISNRLTGGPGNTDCLNNAEQMGEGWSDYVALMVTTNWATATTSDGANKRPLGTFVLNQPATGGGIRTYPYSTNMAYDPWTYAMLTNVPNGEVHTTGEIWCSALWDMTWNIIQQENSIDPSIYHGLGGNGIALNLVIEGLKLQPCSPGFLDGRDAILKADSILYGYAHKCAIWNAFARRGMGKSAVQGSSNNYQDQTAAFDLPGGVSVAQTISKTSALAQGDNVTYTIKATCDCAALTNVSVVDTLSANLSYVSSSTGGVYTAPYVRFNGIDFSPGETKTFTVQATVGGTYAPPQQLLFDNRDDSVETWTLSAGIGTNNFTTTTSRYHSPSTSWVALDFGYPTDYSITSKNVILDTLTKLSFWHYYETDASYDGGVVEISTDGGTTWKDLGPYMIQNGYNTTLSPYQAAPGSLGNRSAFSGSTGGVFIQTIAALTGFAGQTARIRFRFASDSTYSGTGWYIDDIRVTNEKATVASAAAYSGSTALGRANIVSAFAPIALPVNFLGFDARKAGSTGLLSWKVSGEVNVGKYIVERSSDGSSFTAIGEVLPSVAASFSASKDYGFTDAAPLDGNNFYRIVEKDIDGRTTISSIRLLTFTSGVFVKVSPVPTYTHSVQLELQTASDAPVAVYLVNAVGQTLKVFTAKPGVNQLNLSAFARGLYYLKVQTGRDAVEIRKLVIQ